MTTSAPEPDAIGRVEVGMTVRDSDGERVGTVSATKMGDPEAVTEEGQRMPAGFVDRVVESFGHREPAVHPQLAKQLLRTGYIKIDAGGLFARDLYASPTEIAEVDRAEVRLAVPGDRLVPGG